MGQKDAFTKILAIAGTLCVWFPVAAPVILAIGNLIERGRFHFDYLMPAELYPVAIIGGAMLIWAAVRAKKRRKLIIWAVALTFLLPVVGQGLAMLTGVATGEVEETFWRLAPVIAALALYTVALIAAGIGGALLLRDIYGEKKDA